MRTIIVIALVVVIAAILSMLLARRGPRVTQIDRTIVRKEGEGR